MAPPADVLPHDSGLPGPAATPEPEDLSCVVCLRRPPERGWVCAHDHATMAEQLAALPGRLVGLRLRLVLGQGPTGERVDVSRDGSPAPLNIDVLSALADGSEYVSGSQGREVDRVPVVRRWRTQRLIEVAVPTISGVPRVQRRVVTDFHRELVVDDDGRPVMVAVADQTGGLPPAVWLDSWVRDLRKRLGDPVPARTRRAPAPPPRRPRRLDAVAAMRLPALIPAVALMAAANTLTTTAHARHLRTVTGLDDGRGHPPAERDPIAWEWQLRYGPARPALSLLADVDYLLTHLDDLCADGDGVHELAGELRALTAELEVLAGDRPDDLRLGRCPVQLQADGAVAHCGAWIWQDPYASEIQCPRCRSTWHTPAEKWALVRAIRQVWPLDRHRRYTAADRAALREPPRCPTCGMHLIVTWRETTARADRARSWRIDRVTCAAGCAAAARMA